MRLVCSIIFSLFTSLGYAQIKFEPVFIDACSGKMDTLINFWLVDNEGKVYTKTKSNEKNLIIAPHLGTYLLHFGRIYRPGFMYEPIEVNVIKDNTADTFNSNNKLNFKNQVCVIYFSSCNGRANGHIKDYNYNGKLRAEGTFKNGAVIKDFIYFNREGTKIEHREKTKRDSFYKSYYSNGELRKEHNTFKRITQKRNIDGSQTYLKKWTKKGFTKKELKYDTATRLSVIQTSHSKKMYSTTGLLQQEHKKRELFSSWLERLVSKEERLKYFMFSNYSSVYFDSFGQKSHIIKYGDFNSKEYFNSAFPDRLADIDSNIITSLVNFKQGKPIEKLKEKSKKVNGKWIYYIQVYKRKNGRWTKVRKESATYLEARIHSINY